MTLEERINQDLKTAIKAKDQAALRGLRAIKAAIQTFNTSGSGQILDQGREWQLLQKLVKQRRESLDIYERENREDLAAKEREEIDIIESYLPQQMSEADIEAELRRIIEETGAESMKDMGKVMSSATREMAGRADGKTISALARKLLTA